MNPLNSLEQAQTDELTSKRGWKKFSRRAVYAAVFILVLAPEMAMFAFLLDAAVIDLIVVFTGIQCGLYWIYLKAKLAAGASWIKGCLTTAPWLR